MTNLMNFNIPVICNAEVLRMCNRCYASVKALGIQLNVNWFELAAAFSTANPSSPGAMGSRKQHKLQHTSDKYLSVLFTLPPE
jgi:hypothetical protein